MQYSVFSRQLADGGLAAGEVGNGFKAITMVESKSPEFDYMEDIWVIR